MTANPENKRAWPPRLRIWIDPKANKPALEKDQDDHEDLGHIDCEYISEQEHKHLANERAAESWEKAALFVDYCSHDDWQTGRLKDKFMQKSAELRGKEGKK